MTEKNILLICYYFPPLGGAGIARPMALMKHLSEFGYNCDVLTVKPVTYRVYESELLYEIESDNIYRAGSFDPQRLLYLLGVRKIKPTTIDKRKNIKSRFFPDSKIGWVRPAVRLGRKLVKAKNYTVIISTSPPMSVHLVGRKLSQEFKIPWIADFRDYWESQPFEECYDNENDIQKASQLLDEIKQQATLVTTVSKLNAEYLKDAQYIYNSYDDELAGEWSVPVSEKKVTIGLFGTFDNLCPIEPLFKVLASMREKYPESFDKIELRQVGRVDREWFRDLLNKYRLLEKCQLYGFLPRLQAVKIISKASLFYLSLDPKIKYPIIPGRVFLLLASGRPILGLTSKEGELANLIMKDRESFVFSENEIEITAGYLNKLVDKILNNSIKIEVMPEYSREFSSLKMTEKFVDIFKKIENAPWFL